MTSNNTPTNSNLILGEGDEFKEKFKFVTWWLRELLKKNNNAGQQQQGTLPSFEATPQTVDILYNIAKKNLLIDEHYNALIQDTERRTEEYKLQTRRIEETLSAVGLSLQLLSQSGTASLRSLASLAVTLDLIDTELSSYLLALTDQSHLEYQVSEKRALEATGLELLSSKTKSGMLKLTELRRQSAQFVDQLESQKPNTEMQRQALLYFSSKSKEYQTTLQHLKESLLRSSASSSSSSSSGGVESTNHSLLVKLSQEVEQLKKATGPHQAKLQAYHDLPPDPQLAMLKVHQAQAELAQLEASLSVSLANVTL